MKLTIKLECECGNYDFVEIKRGKEFNDYDMFAEEFAIQESISESGKFKAHQVHPESFHISCSKCNKEIEVI